MTTFLLIGSRGLVGGGFRRSLPPDRLFIMNRSEYISDRSAEMVQKIKLLKPDVVLNCAAHTDVESEERDPTLGLYANAQLPGILAQACQSSGSILVHLSSTGCYGRSKLTPYLETDNAQPDTAHHKAKIEGEKNILGSEARHVILRTGWLFGGDWCQAKNFVWKRLVDAHGSLCLTSDNEQIGCPTRVDDVVKQTLKILRAEQLGIFNVVAQGQASRFEYVSEIVSAAKLACAVKPGPSFQRLAPVSMNETAINARLQMLGMDIMPDWRQSLRAYVGELTRSAAWSDLNATSSVSDHAGL